MDHDNITTLQLIVVEIKRKITGQKNELLVWIIANIKTIPRGNLEIKQSIKASHHKDQNGVKTKEIHPEDSFGVNGAEKSKWHGSDQKQFHSMMDRHEIKILIHDEGCDKTNFSSYPKKLQRCTRPRRVKGRVKIRHYGFHGTISTRPPRAKGRHKSLYRKKRFSCFSLDVAPRTTT